MEWKPFQGNLHQSFTISDKVRGTQDESAACSIIWASTQQRLYLCERTGREALHDSTKMHSMIGLQAMCLYLQRSFLPKQTHVNITDAETAMPATKDFSGAKAFLYFRGRPMLLSKKLTPSAPTRQQLHGWVMGEESKITPSWNTKMTLQGTKLDGILLTI